MKDNDVLQSIDIAYNESKCLLDSAILIEANEIGGDIRVPTSFMNSSFGMWLYTDGLSLAKSPWFNPIVEQHQRVYEGYSKLFHGAKKSNGITELFTHLESLIEDYHQKLDEVKKEFSDDAPEPELKQVEVKDDSLSQSLHVEREQTEKLADDVEQVDNPNPLIDKGMSRTEELLAKLGSSKKTPSDTSDISDSNGLRNQTPKNDLSDEYLDIHNELKKETQNQLELKQELIEQELVQVKDRQKLFTKTINQLDYYHLLKEKETKFADNSYKEKLSKNSALKEKKLSNLKDIQTKRENTQQEFEKMELASIEFEKVNVIERAEEKERVDQLDQEQIRVEKDHKKVINLQAKKKKVLEGLKERAQQAERELDSLIDEESEVNNTQELISKKKLIIQHEIEERLVKQHHDREHYLQLEELKFQSLQRVKKQYYSTQQDVLHLEHEQQSISQGKKESDSLRLKEIEQLQEQREVKQRMFDVLDLEYKKKKLELGEITKMQKKAQQASIEEMEKFFALEV